MHQDHAGGLLAHLAYDPGFLAAFDAAQRQAVRATLAPLVGTHGMLALGWWLVAAALAAWGRGGRTGRLICTTVALGCSPRSSTASPRPICRPPVSST